MQVDQWQNPICSVCRTTCEKCHTKDVEPSTLQRGTCYSRSCVKCREDEEARAQLEAFFVKGHTLSYHPTRAEITTRLEEIEAGLAPLRAIYLK